MFSCWVGDPMILYSSVYGYFRATPWENRIGILVRECECSVHPNSDERFEPHDLLKHFTKSEDTRTKNHNSKK